MRRTALHCAHFPDLSAICQNIRKRLSHLNVQLVMTTSTNVTVKGDSEAALNGANVVLCHTYG